MQSHAADLSSAAWAEDRPSAKHVRKAEGRTLAALAMERYTKNQQAPHHLFKLAMHTCTPQTLSHTPGRCGFNSYQHALAVR